MQTKDEGLYPQKKEEITNILRIRKRRNKEMAIYLLNRFSEKIKKRFSDHPTNRQKALKRLNRLLEEIKIRFT